MRFIVETIKSLILAVLLAASPLSAQLTPTPEPVALEQKASVYEAVSEGISGVWDGINAVFAEKQEPITETVTVAEPEPIIEVPTTEENWNVIQNCTITHYCNCSRCCGQWAGGPTASGVMPTVNHTVAVDKSVIPLGSEVLINGTVYIAEDTGVKGNWIDIYVGSHSEALQRGMYTTTVQWR